MEISKKFGFYLPSRDGDDIADINQISDNFRIIDDAMLGGDDMPTADQTFDPESENAQSGIAIEERLKSKVLLDVTLTEEQAGVSSVMVAIPNCQLLKKAKYWNIRLVHPYTEVKAANTVWYNCALQNETAGTYNICIANGYNIDFSSSCTKAFWYITVFNSAFDSRGKAGGSLVSYYSQVNPWGEQSSANSASSTRTNIFTYIDSAFTEEIPAYLVFSNSSSFIFEAGTRIYLEVIL